MSWTHGAWFYQELSAQERVGSTRAESFSGGRHENGVIAFFSEQAASASHVGAARSLDALARMPDCDGFDIDAIGARVNGRNRPNGADDRIAFTDRAYRTLIGV